jgi:lipopolysaccharide transport system ATP-binding protein
VGFQVRCLDRLEELIESGTSILLASHDLQLIKNYCTGAICLDRGRVVAEGDPALVAERYYYLMRTGRQLEADALTWHADAGGARFASRRGAIEEVEIETPGGADGEFPAGSALTVRVVGRLFEDGIAAAVILMLRDARGYNLYGLLAQSPEQLAMQSDGGFQCRFRLPLKLAEGRYSLTVRLEDRRTQQLAPVLDKHVGVCHFRVVGAAPDLLGCVDLGGAVLPAAEPLIAG